LSAWKAFVVKIVALGGGRYDRYFSWRTCIGCFLSTGLSVASHETVKLHTAHNSIFFPV
jgi:hypothetical protein